MVYNPIAMTISAALETMIISSTQPLGSPISRTPTFTNDSGWLDRNSGSTAASSSSSNNPTAPVLPPGAPSCPWHERPSNPNPDDLGNISQNPDELDNVSP
jgi:hypothetical protein